MPTLRESALEVEAMESASIADLWASLNAKERDQILSTIPTEEMQRILFDWDIWSRPDQRLPTGDWFCWALISGRGAGKTRTGAETIKKWVGGPKDPPIRIALVAESAPDARDVMIEGDSGLLAVSPPWNRPIYQPSKRRITWPNGSIGITFSGDKPDQLRGPQFHKAWVDEIAKFQYPDDVWDNLELGLRLGTMPQAIVTTTPRPIKLIRELVADPLTIMTRVSTYANIGNLAPTFIRRVVQKYEGTRLGRQELNAEILSDTPGALWNYDLVEENRVKIVPELRRVVIAIDPAASSEEDSNETGLVVCGKGADGKGYVLSDMSGIYSPGQWGLLAIKLYREWGATRFVVEKNQGGEMAEHVLRSRWMNAPITMVHASERHEARAEPVAALYEQGKVKHVGQFARMEDQMCLTTTDGFQGTGSPDRMDAMVWGMTNLMLGAVVSYEESDYAEYRR